MREPLRPSMAYTIGVGVGRGRSLDDGASVISSSSIPACAGRGTMMYTEETNPNRLRLRADMANAQRPYEQYLVIVHFLFTLS